jgi:hypothetical protein
LQGFGLEEGGGFAMPLIIALGCIALTFFGIGSVAIPVFQTKWGKPLFAIGGWVAFFCLLFYGINAARQEQHPDASDAGFIWCLAAAGGGVAFAYVRNRDQQKRRTEYVPASTERMGIRRIVNSDAPSRVHQATVPKPFAREDLIEHLCGQTRTLIISREGTDYWVRPPCAARTQSIRVGVGGSDVLFQQHFCVKFPLDRETPGLFARLMLRNFDLHYGAWSMHIAGQCDGNLSVAARIPIAGLDVTVFESVCRELIDEIERFGQELHDKFKWGVGPAVGGQASVRQSVPEVVYVQPVQQVLPHEPMRYRLPGKK